MTTTNQPAMKTELPSSLTAEQLERCIALATADAAHWTAEAKEGTLPAVETMSLDWQIDEDLRDAGVDAYALQALSFEIATIHGDQGRTPTMKTIQITDINSAAIRSQAREDGIESVTLLAESGEGDKKISIYQYGQVRVADTNGDPVWEDSVSPEEWKSLLATSTGTKGELPPFE